MGKRRGGGFFSNMTHFGYTYSPVALFTRADRFYFQIDVFFNTLKEISSIVVSLIFVL